MHALSIHSYTPPSYPTLDQLAPVPGLSLVGQASLCLYFHDPNMYSKQKIIDRIKAISIFLKVEVLTLILKECMS